MNTPEINTIVDDYAISAEYLFENPLEDSPFETWQEYQKTIGETSFRSTWKCSPNTLMKPVEHCGL